MTTSPRGRALAASLLATIALVACQSSDRGSGGGATSDGPTSGGAETSVFDIEARECFNITETEPVESVQVLPCDDPHVYEAYAVLDHPAGPDAPFPGQDEMTDASNAACQEQFAAYIGLDYESSEFFITTLNPSEETWAEGDREIICTVATEDEDAVTGTARGSGR